MHALLGHNFFIFAWWSLHLHGDPLQSVILRVQWMSSMNLGWGGGGGGMCDLFRGHRKSFRDGKEREGKGREGKCRGYCKILSKIVK